MSTTDSRIVQMLTGKNNLAEVTIDTLNEIAVQQPYNSVIQLLITKKMKEENHPSLHQQIHKASLYFPDAHWLHYQLYHASLVAPEEPAVSSDWENVEPVRNEAFTAESSIVESEDAVTTDEIFVTEPADSEAEENILPADDVFVTEPINEDVDEETDASEGENDSAMASENISRVLSEQAKIFQQPVADEQDILIENEPFHTVDYFASQGIALETELPSQDQLEAKMRKFTDWLKQMKHGHKTKQPLDLGTPPELEHAARNIAESSNTPKEVATEAMADVLIKQGKLEKAIEVYLKLSFLNPEKSAYFASKIQDLKGI